MSQLLLLQYLITVEYLIAKDAFYDLYMLFALFDLSMYSRAAYTTLLANMENRWFWNLIFLQIQIALLKKNEKVDG